MPRSRHTWCAGSASASTSPTRSSNASTGRSSATLMRVGDAGRRVQNGSIHRYLAFSFAALVAVLLVVTR